MMTKPAIMLDIETMDTEPSAAVLTIGGCYFDADGHDTEETITDAFSVAMSLESNMAAGRTVSAGTIMWWLQQTKDAQKGLYEGDITNLRTGLIRLRKWIQDHEPMPQRVWAKDPDFDVVILRNAFAQIGEMFPFKFWETRSVRTITELAYPDGDPPPIGVGVAHNAKDDAIRQALMVQHCHHVLSQ